jgi:hypothetical protein
VHGKEGEIDGVILMIDARSEDNNKKDMINKAKYQLLRERVKYRRPGNRTFLNGAGGRKKEPKKNGQK